MKEKSLKQKMFYVMCGIGFIVLTMMSLIVLVFLWHQMDKETRTLARVSLSNTDVVFQEYITQAKNMGNSWYGSSDGVQSRIDAEYKFPEHMAFVNQMREEISHVPYIQSVYLMVSGPKCRFSVGNGYSYTRPLEEELMKRIRNEEMVNGYFIWSVENYLTSPEELPLMSLYCQEVSPQSDNYTGTLIINLDLRRMSRRLFSGTLPMNVEMYILNENGMVMLSSVEADCGRSWRNEEFVRRILEDGKTEFSERKDRHTYDYIVLDSSQSDVYLVAKLIRPQFVGNLGGLLVILLFIWLTLAFLIVFMTFRASDHLYRPLAQVISEIRQGSEETKNAEGKDIRFLKNAYQNLSTYITTLENKTEADEFVKNLVTGNKEGKPQEILLKNHTVFGGVGYYLILVSLSGDGDLQNADMHMFEARRNMVGQLLSAGLDVFGQCTIFELGIRRLLLVISETKDTKIDEEQLLEELNVIHTTAEQAGNSSIYILISQKIPDGNISCLLPYHIIDDGLKIQRFLPESRVVQRLTDVVMIYPEDMEEKILTCLKQKDYDAYLDAVRCFLIRSQYCIYGTFIFWLARLSENIMRLNQILSLTGTKGKKIEDYICDQLEQLADYQDLKQWFTTLYQQVTIQLFTVSGHSNAAIMEKVVDDVSNNYSDDGMNITSLAEKYNISAAYFGKLFREFTGESLNTYIMRTRMEKAGDILVEFPEKEIAQIGQMVGIANPSYFGILFKKYYGVSPSKYRDYKKTQKSEEK